MRGVGLLLFLIATCATTTRGETNILLRAGYGVPSGYQVGTSADVQRRVVDAFFEKYPYIQVVSTQGMHMPGGSRTQDLIPFMQIAGDIAPDVLFVNFRQSQTYIDKKLLYPLDQYVEAAAGVALPDGE